VNNKWKYPNHWFYGSATSAQGFKAETNFQQDFKAESQIGALIQEQKAFL